MGLQRKGSSKQTWDPWGGSTLIVKGIKGESSLFFTVICVNVFSYHIDIISSHCKVLYQPFLLNGNLKLLRLPVKKQFYYSSFIRFIHSFFFLPVLPWQVTVSDAGRPVFSFGHTLTLLCPLYAIYRAVTYIAQFSR